MTIIMRPRLPRSPKKKTSPTMFPPCNHCKLQPKDHDRGKCPAKQTFYYPMDESQWFQWRQRV